MLLKKIALAAAIAGSTIGAAQALPLINGTASIANLAVTSIPLGSIALGSTFNFGFSLVSGTTGDLTVVPINTPLTTMSMTATTSTPVNFSATWGKFAGSVLTATQIGGPLNRTVSITALGMFTPLSGPPNLQANFDPGLMSLTFSATQTGGPTGSISASYTIASPPAVPEPGSLALVGLGLLAAGAAARRKMAA